MKTKKMISASEMIRQQRAKKAERELNKASKVNRPIQRDAKSVLLNKGREAFLRNLGSLDLSRERFRDEEFREVESGISEMVSKMRKECDADTCRKISFIITCFKVHSKIFAEYIPDIKFYIQMARQSLEKWVEEFDDLSPNQRDRVLEPIYDFILNIAIPNYKNMPRETIEIVSSYVNGYTFAIWGVKFLNSDSFVLDAIPRIANGESLRKIAKETEQYNERELREAVIEAANAAYEAMREWVKVSRPYKIDDLRTPEWIAATKSNYDEFIQFLARNQLDVVNYFEKRIGFTVFDYESFIPAARRTGLVRYLKI